MADFGDQLIKRFGTSSTIKTDFPPLTDNNFLTQSECSPGLGRLSQHKVCVCMLAQYVLGWLLLELQFWVQGMPEGFLVISERSQGLVRECA